MAATIAATSAAPASQPAAELDRCRRSSAIAANSQHDDDRERDQKLDGGHAEHGMIESVAQDRPVLDAETGRPH
ncbi:hypothetical protein QIH85_43095 [Bradyrhizobium japonicum]|uniref:hypothetical protein n=1 Tax=Bradyrhizobium japonicum TaxID=375 RepID=UPI001E5396AD|nr:hypothetical protein [Bradyrhizobium japonicum]MCD9898258.1 hypothetical protein [Bradyrhizobium japonicum]WLB28519.1 hypothetical protein QIH85_43095 [Bradyrhizobium japonicum]WRJ84727.1 hypothetical protein R3F78_07560 [Bradyrhizobium japonicum]WRJ93697.1 hypothetical protein R3F77_05270 [Bradyrhizobium japonicum]WRK47549.1 hypothetical protein R3F73_05330 [Bradyrhizobium japonicum]